MSSFRSAIHVAAHQLVVALLLARCVVMKQITYGNSHVNGGYKTSFSCGNVDSQLMSAPISIGLSTLMRKINGAMECALPAVRQRTSERAKVRHKNFKVATFSWRHTAVVQLQATTHYLAATRTFSEHDRHAASVPPTRINLAPIFLFRSPRYR